MKKTILFLVIAFSILSIQSFSQFRFSLQSGLGIAKVRYDLVKEEGFSKKHEPVISFNIGAVAEYELSARFSLGTGLSIQRKGGQVEFQSLVVQFGSQDLIFRNTLNYLEIPFHLVFKARLVRFNIGSYTAFGLSGRNKTEAIFPNYGNGREKSSYEYDIRYKNEVHTDLNTNRYRYFKPIDWGLNLGIGIQPGNFGIFLNYAFGLSNIEPVYIGSKSSGVSRVSNRAVTVNVKYLLFDGKGSVKSEKKAKEIMLEK